MGHAAVWTGLYVAACTFCAIHTSVHRLPPATWLAILGAFLVGQSVYLLDRAKLRDAWLDEADREAHPKRFAFIYRHRRILRGVIVVEAIAGGSVLLAVHPLLALIVPAAFGGVIVYAGLPRTSFVPPGTRRIKDLLIVKNLAVAGSIAVFALAIAVAVAEDDAVRWPWWRWSWTGAFLLLHVLADSMLCDIDDAAADERFGTRTLAWMRSAGFVRGLAVGIAFALALVTSALLVIGERSLERGTIDLIRAQWANAMLISSIALVWAPAGDLRDAVDLRLPMVAVVLGGLQHVGRWIR